MSFLGFKYANLVQHAPLKDAPEVLACLVHSSVLEGLMVDAVNNRDSHGGVVPETSKKFISKIIINLPPVNWSQEGWQPVLIDLAVSV